MPLRFFRKENSSSARRERAEQIEKAFAQGLRTLSELFKKTAEIIEARRLERGGYEKQDKYLERVTPPPPGDRR
ncbi:MAG: hypothetical protein U0228_02365 [Myxococcaceae bacterium]